MTRPRSLTKNIALWYVSRRLKRAFVDVRVHRLDLLSSYIQQGPIVLALNHVCWWDPLVLIQLSSAVDFDGYALMDHNNLKMLPFFSWLGARPINSGSPRQAHRDLQDAAALLDRPGRVVALFPSGRQRAIHRPLEFKSGVLALSRLGQAPIVPVALRYDFSEGPRAVVHLCVAEALPVVTRSPGEALSDLESRTYRALNEVDELLENKGNAPSILYKKPLSLSKERVPLGARLLRFVWK